MSEIIDKLDRWGGSRRMYGEISDACNEAKAEIARLTACVKALEEGLIPAGWQRRRKYTETTQEWEECPCREAEDPFQHKPNYEYRRVFARALLTPAPAEGGE